jgi:FkbM family methyltransferase
MQTPGQTPLIESLASKQYTKRVEKARRFEHVEGGGTLKQIQRLLTAPSIYLPYLVYAKGGLSRRHLTKVKLFWGREVYIPLEDYDALILYMYGGLYGSELKFTKFLIKNLGKDDVFYDVGANRGFYTFLGADLCKETHTFEPMSELTDVIRKNVRPSDTVVVNTAALSDRNGTVDFYIMESTMLNTINPSVVDQLSTQDHSVSKKITVPTITIDEYIKTHAQPTLLKIDAEGAEYQIVKGGMDFFSKNTPIVTIEIWGKENKWELSMSAAERLRGMGFKSYRLDNEGDMHEIQGDLSELVPSTSGENFIFKK